MNVRTLIGEPVHRAEDFRFLRGAGAFIDDTTVARAEALGLVPAAFLADNDSTGFFNGIGDLFTPGPTFTNVTDFRAIVVDRPGN